MRIDAKTFLSMLKSGANALDNNKEKINNMNVFPVPDGDTGINMTLTLGAVRKMDKNYTTVGSASSDAAALVLRSARGNSGAILSLFLRGFSKEFKDKVSIGVTELAAGLRRGCEEAYKAVMKPTEGTILTVMRRSAEEAEKALKGGKYGDHCLSASHISLQQTVHLMTALHVVADLRDHPFLCSCQREGK